MGHSDIGVTLNTYTLLGLEDATDERQKGTGKEQRRKARLTEDVPGNLNKESFGALLRWGVPLTD